MSGRRGEWYGRRCHSIGSIGLTIRRGCRREREWKREGAETNAGEENAISAAAPE